MNSNVDDMILACLQKPAIAEVIRDRIKNRFDKYYYASYITKRLSFLIKSGHVLSSMVFKDGEKKHYAEYRLNGITAPPRDDSGQGTTDRGGVEMINSEPSVCATGAPGESLIQHDEICVCEKSYYSRGGKCNKCGRERNKCT